MKNALRIGLCAGALAAMAALSAVAAEGCDKNHFILTFPCTVERQWVSTGALNVARFGHTATLLADGKVLVAGGQSGDGAGMMVSAELYDPATGAWTLTGSLNVPRSGHLAVMLPNGKVLVAGGDYAANPPFLAGDGSAELYDTVTGLWSPTGKLNTARQAFNMTLLQTGEVLVAGGVNNADDTLSSAELYNPATGMWRFTGHLLTARFGHTATLLQDGKVLVVAGTADDFWEIYVGDAEIYDPAAENWTRAGSVQVARQDHTATMLASGAVLIAGGYADVTPQNWLRDVKVVDVPTSYSTVDVFAPGSGWSKAADLTVPRMGHTATLLTDGEVIVAGGYDWNSVMQLVSTELYDPSTGAWRVAKSLGSSRNLHTATLLLDGSVLVAGGYGLTGGWESSFKTKALDSAELYGPASLQ
jgi:N-acetylneuraminic acid mutarotase